VDFNVKIAEIDSLEKSVLVTVMVFPFKGMQQIQLTYIGHHSPEYQKCIPTD
jgi:hypothetical protein